jgi:hypothetical protein
MAKISTSLILCALLVVAPCLYGQNAMFFGQNAGAAPGPAKVVNAAASNESGGVSATTVTLTIAAGHLAVIHCGQGTNSTSTLAITDSTSGSNTWQQTSSGYSTTSGSRESAMFYSLLSVGVTTVTGTWSGGLSATVRCTLYDIENATTEDVSVNSQNATSSTSFTSGSLTTLNANDVLLFGVSAIGALAGAWSVTSPFAFESGGNGNYTAMSYQIVSTIQSGVTSTMGNSDTSTYTGVFAAFK